jgi:hypothetical protein
MTSILREDKTVRGLHMWHDAEGRPWETRAEAEARRSEQAEAARMTAVPVAAPLARLPPPSFRGIPPPPYDYTGTLSYVLRLAQTHHLTCREWRL